MGNMCYNVHDEYKHLEVSELKAVSKESRLRYDVCLINLEHDLNIGNCIRSAHIFGANRVFIFGRRRYDLRSTVGAHHYIDIVKHDFDDITDSNAICEAFDNMVLKYDLTPVVIEKTEDSFDIKEMNQWLSDTDPFATPCLVLGNEQNGVPECIANKYQCFHIPQRGVIRSLNVSSAAAVAMYELQQYITYS